MTYRVDAIELRKAMLDMNITTVEELSNVSGVNRNTISAILGGKTRPTSTVIEKLAIALELDGSAIGRIFFSQNLA